MKKFCLYIFFHGNLSYYLLRNKLHSFHFIFFSPLKKYEASFLPILFSIQDVNLFIFALFFRGQLNLANLCVHFPGFPSSHLFFLRFLSSSSSLLLDWSVKRKNVLN